MKQWLNRLKISHKMLLGFLGLIALPCTFLLVYNFGSFSTQYEQQITQSGRYMLGTVVRDVNEKLDQVEMLVQVLASNRRLISFLSHDYDGAASYEEYTQTVLPLLQGAGNTVSPPIDRILLFTENPSIPEGYSTVYHMDAALSTELSPLPGREGTWFMAQEEGGQVLYYQCPIASTTIKSQGYLLAKLQGDQLFSEFGAAGDADTALFLLDEEGSPLFSNVVTQPGFQFPGNGTSQGRVRYFSLPLKRIPLQVGVALFAGEYGALQQNSLTALFFMGILSVLFLSLFYSMLRSIIARLRRYGHEMDQIAARDFEGQLQVERQDEIGTIGRQFNQVLGRMHLLMRENIQKETAYKDAQLKALLLQINPHFIYNTLDMFAGKLILDGEVEVAETMSDFAQMIRYNTMASSISLPLREELDHVRNYISLQKCRYGSSVVLRVHAAPDLLELAIPRFLLQPIVENSFEHGFAGKAPQEERRIVISARKVRDRLILRVRDNGRGVGPQQVEDMNEKFARPYDALALRHEEKRGIGLENINDRLRIFSRSGDRLVLRSREGRFTSMFILLGLR